MINLNCKIYDITISGTLWGIKYAKKAKQKFISPFQTCLGYHDRQQLLITFTVIKQHKKNHPDTYTCNKFVLIFSVENAK